MTAKKKIPVFAAAVATLLAAGVACAAPEVTLEFDSMFGHQAPYVPCTEDELVRVGPDSEDIACLKPPNTHPPTGFTAPAGIDFLRADRLIIADQGNDKLQLCDLQGGCSWMGGDEQYRNTPGTFAAPHGIEVNGDGFIAIADEGNNAVQRCTKNAACAYSGLDFNQDNDCSSAFGKWCLPQDTAYNAAGELLGLDTGNHRIQVLRLSDLQLRRVHQLPEGTALGQANNPRGIAVDAEDRILIADTGNDRIQVCERVLPGNALDCEAFGSKGTATGKFNAPVGIDVDALDRIWVADTGNDRIQVCDHQGGCVPFGGPGDGPFEFDAPQDVAVHPSGLVAVVDTGNNRIQLFRTFAINAGMSDAWVSPQVPLQGFMITVWQGEHHGMFLAQFTFDSQRPDAGVIAVVGGAGQRWVTASGDYQGATAVLSAELTTGMLFDSADPAVVQTQGYGTYTVTFEDCEHGTIAYDFPDLELTGEIPVKRVSNDNVALCEALQGQ